MQTQQLGECPGRTGRRPGGPHRGLRALRDVGLDRPLREPLDPTLGSVVRADAHVEVWVLAHGHVHRAFNATVENGHSSLQLGVLVADGQALLVHLGFQHRSGSRVADSLPALAV